jgi:hypothetical protein
MFKDGLSHNSGLGRKEQIAQRPRPNFCEVCYLTAKPDFDHDHLTGKFRGWLDPKPYLAVRGFNSKTVIECAICPTKFVAEDGVAFPARNGEEPIIALFCTAICYLSALPREAMGRA